MKKRRHSGYILVLFVIIVAIIAFTFYTSPEISPTITGAASTSVGNLTVGIQTYVSCSISTDTANVSFGTNLDPGDSDVNATLNFVGDTSTYYNISASALNNLDANVTIKGENLISGANVIGVGNVTWKSADNNTATWQVSGSIPIETDYDAANPVAFNLAAESTKYLRFWIDVPAEQVSGNYAGNFSLYCTQA